MKARRPAVLLLLLVLALLLPCCSTDGTSGPVQPRTPPAAPSGQGPWWWPF